MSVTNRRGTVAVLVILLAFVHSVAAIWPFGRTTDTDGAIETDKDSSQESVSYGVDVSYPMHYEKVSDNYAWLPHNVHPESESTPRRYKDMPIQPLGDRQKFYDDLMKGCAEASGEKGGRCKINEQDRIAMSLRQPQSMQNYTATGFKKIRAPEEVFKHIKQFWDVNKDQKKKENWGSGNTYTNNWEVPSYMVSLEDKNLKGGGTNLKRQVWDSARKTIEEWTGERLTESSLYGIRVYEEGAVLATHVDRLPLVSSAIINVDQDVDEPWPLEVIGHDGKAHNVTMVPGDMVLYESHSILHGRPFPLKGRFMANVFIHFEPTGHSLRHNAKKEADDHVDQKVREATAVGAGGDEADEGTGLPSYIIPGTPEEANWRKLHPDGTKTKQKSFTTGSMLPEANQAAQSGDLETLAKVVENDKNAVNTKDRNGWTPLHEAARGGHDQVAKFLYENGANVNENTKHHGTPLYVANKYAGKDHPVTVYLESVGALNLGPEL